MAKASRDDPRHDDEHAPEAAANAVKTAAQSLRDIRIAEITKLDMVVDDDGKVAVFRARVNLSFKYEK